ncbi:MAG TPA: Uma2 family endonuclease, partial [Aggregatilineales bacterium]|nr:Uma2 family endonuclease [Aggregatilineales bacterium]
DHGEKLEEYQKGGVREYWIIDPALQECRLNRLNEEGVYLAQKTDVNENYHTPLLPKFSLHVPTLWKKPLPNFFEIGDSVRAMFPDAEEFL